MRTRVGVTGAVAALAFGATAVAQAPAPPIGNFGGGRVLLPNSDPLGKGNAVIGLRVVSSGRIQIEATVRGNCGGGTFRATGQVRPSGRFRLKGTNIRRPQRGVRLKTRYDITGRLTATGVDNGLAKAVNQIRATGFKTMSCTAGKNGVPFKLRRPGSEIGTPGAAPNTRYFGMTSERRNQVRRGIVLRVSTSGKTLRRALYGVTLRCDKRKIPDVVDTPRKQLTIDSQGRVVDNVKSKFRDATTVTRSDERFSGTFGSTGAQGTLSITERIRSRRTNRLLDTCRTGKISWTAAP